MRPLLPLAVGIVVAATAATPAIAAPKFGVRPPVRPPVILTVFVGENATAMMPFVLWSKLVTEYVGAPGRIVELDEGTVPADEARCKAAHARYAVLATFDRATRLPGLAQDPDRAYAVGRFTVRDCKTGSTGPVKTVALESDPMTPDERGVNARDPERMWARSVRAALAHSLPLLSDSTTPK